MSKSEKFGEMHRILRREMAVIHNNEMTASGITLPQFQALMKIGYAGSISLNDLAEALILDKSTMSRTVDHLEESGYTMRTVNSDDKRYLNITLTEKGQHLFDDIKNRLDRHYRNIYKLIPADKRDQFMESMLLFAQATLEYNGSQRNSIH